MKEDLSEALLTERFTHYQGSSAYDPDTDAACAERCRALMEALDSYEQEHPQPRRTQPQKGN